MSFLRKNVGVLQNEAPLTEPASLSSSLSQPAQTTWEIFKALIYSWPTIVKEKKRQIWDSKKPTLCCPNMVVAKKTTGNTISRQKFYEKIAYSLSRFKMWSLYQKVDI